MDATQKLIRLNTAAMKIRDGMKEIEKLFNKDTYIYGQILKVNKEIMKMHVAIQSLMESEVTKENFKPITDKIKEDGNDG
jgi:hypothetical protein